MIYYPYSWRHNWYKAFIERDIWRMCSTIKISSNVTKCLFWHEFFNTMISSRFQQIADIIFILKLKEKSATQLFLHYLANYLSLISSKLMYKHTCTIWNTQWSIICLSPHLVICQVAMIDLILHMFILSTYFLIFFILTGWDDMILFMQHAWMKRSGNQLWHRHNAY